MDVRTVCRVKRHGSLPVDSKVFVCVYIHITIHANLCILLRKVVWAPGSASTCAWPLQPID